MFRTFDNGEVVLPLDFDGEYLWNYVELVNYSAFLFVKYKSKSDGDSFDQMIFLPDSYALLRFKHTPNITLTEGYLAFPGSGNDVGGWTLSRFTDIFQATVRQGEREAVVIQYLLATGEKMTVNLSGIEVDSNTTFSKIFSFYS